MKLPRSQWLDFRAKRTALKVYIVLDRANAGDSRLRDGLELCLELDLHLHRAIVEVSEVPQLR